MPRPFEQIPFNRLPESPRLAHRWAETEVIETKLDDPHFGSIAIHTRRFGHGPPLLLVHGLMTSSYSWRYQLELLGRHFTLYMPDLPGAGESGCPDCTYGADALADLLARLIDALGIAGTAVIGNSLGGYLVMRLALRHPLAVGRMVNLHSPAIPIARLRLLRAVLSVPGTESILAALVARDPERWVHRNVHYYDETLKSREEARVWAAPLRSRAGQMAFHRWLRDALNPAELTEFVETLRARSARNEPFVVPLMLVYAKSDPMVPPAVGEALSALLPDSPIVWLDEASHFAHVDAAEQFAAVALPWLQAK
jgi:pimeloyl-ACP methyl ester carboxylesterase